jgi:hypothetical protein
MTVISAGSANSEPNDPVAWIIQYENAAAADLAGDVSFYQKNLTDDWSDGMSNDQFQTEQELISNLTDRSTTSLTTLGQPSCSSRQHRTPS